MLECIKINKSESVGIKIKECYAGIERFNKSFRSGLFKYL